LRSSVAGRGRATRHGRQTGSRNHGCVSRWERAVELLDSAWLLCGPREFYWNTDAVPPWRMLAQVIDSALVTCSLQLYLRKSRFFEGGCGRRNCRYRLLFQRLAVHGHLQMQVESVSPEGAEPWALHPFGCAQGRLSPHHPQAEKRLGLRSLRRTAPVLLRTPGTGPRGGHERTTLRKQEKCLKGGHFL